MIPRDLFFLSPFQLIHLLWIIPLGFIALLALQRQKINAKHLISNMLSPLVLKARDPFLTGISLICFMLGWIMAVIALMQPIGNEQYLAASGEMQKGPPSLDLYILLDVSQSMAVKDARSSETRLQRSLEIADPLIAKLTSDQVALFAFTTDLTTLVPITYDRVFARLMLREVTINEGDKEGTNLSNALLQLKKEALSLYPKSAKAIVLFSDGGDDQDETSILNTVKELKIPIYTVGVGSIEGGDVPDVLRGGKSVKSKLNEGLLKAIAETSGGRYFAAGEYPIEDLASRIAQSLDRARFQTSFRGIPSNAEGAYQHYFQIPLALAVLFFLLGIMLPKVRSSLFIIVLIPLWGECADPGETLYAEKKFQDAANWYGGELKQLPVQWAQDKIFYNLGTSLDAAGKFEDATRAFSAVSKEAYTFPLFRLRLLYNQILNLRNFAEEQTGGAKAWLLQQALLILQMTDCGPDCPEAVLADLKKALQIELGKVKDSPLTEADYPIVLNALIDLFHINALWPNIHPESIQELKMMVKNAAPYFKSNESFQKIIDAPLKTKEDLLMAAFSLSQIQKDTPTAYLKGNLAGLILSDHLGSDNVRPALIAEAKGFYPFVLAWQKLLFAKGECVCEPWKEVLPLFSEGLLMLKGPKNEAQLPYVYDKWQAALALLENPPQKGGGGGGGQQEASSEALRELQEMQSLDRPKQKGSRAKNPEERGW